MSKQTDNSDGSKVENEKAISDTDLDKITGGTSVIMQMLTRLAQMEHDINSKRIQDMRA